MISYLYSAIAFSESRSLVVVGVYEIYKHYHYGASSLPLAGRISQGCKSSFRESRREYLKICELLGCMIELVFHIYYLRCGISESLVRIVPNYERSKWQDRRKKRECF